MSIMSSSIKGGGRVELKPELEDAIVDLLQSRRDARHPLLPKPFDTGPREQQQSGRRTFLKRLVASHERHTLSLKLNQVSLRDDIKEQQPTKQCLSTTSGLPGTSTSKQNRNGKVRFDLMEAVYKSPEKWKAGSTKKTIVLDRSTPIETVLQQAKDKLKMKKRALRCFYVARKVELELTNNLEGLTDGSTLFVTSQPAADVVQKATDEPDQDADDSPLPDPLEAVKEVYRQRSHQRRRPWHKHIEEVALLSACELPPLPELRAQLPAAGYRQDILKALDASRVLIISGATGCGKSTQIPQYILEASKNVQTPCNIIVTQPRRVAAMALAERVAVEQDSPSPGKPQSTVGYQVRLDSRVTETTQITYQTIGILLRRLTTSLYEKQQVPLADVSHLILDEIHERDMTTDFVLVILRRMLAIIPHLKLVLMSATNTPDLYCNYFHSGTLGIEPIKLQIPGRTFPVEIEYLEDIEKSIGRRLRHREEAPLSSKNEQSEGQEILSPLSPRAIAAIDNSFIARLISHLVKEAVSAEPARKIVHGAILVFLPGRGEIESMARTLQDEDEDELLNIHILHSGISQSLQRLVFQPPPPRKTKLILATNVAETSITIPNVSIVIDTGHVKEARYNSAARIKELVTVWTSKASAIQRTGRAGRTGPGLCYRLYSKAFFEKCMLERTTPEILRTPLDELVLQACLLDEEQNDRQRGPEHDQLSQQGTAPIEFLNSTPDPPPEGSIIHACQHLLEIDALRYVSGEAADIRVRLTPLGYHLAQLPMDTKIGKALIVGTILGCIEPSLTLAASLSSTKNLFWSSENEKQKLLIEQGFGGATWMGGTVKGDSIAAVAVFDQWNSRSNQNKRFLFAKENGLDHSVLTDIRNLREQFRDCMVDAGFLQPQNEANDIHSQNALLTSCCLVAGLYPNIATLVRPTRGKLGFRGGRLLTKDGDSCTPSAESFQSERVRHASESGRDAYCVYQSKNQIIGATKEGTSTSARKQIFLSNVNFVSRFAILLFGGVLEVKDNSLVVDSWLKFKVGEKGRITAILVSELRRELDMVLLDQMVPGSNISEGSHAVVDLVNALLQEE